MQKKNIKGTSKWEVAEVANKISKLRGITGWYIRDNQNHLFIPFLEEFTSWKACVKETLRRMFVVKRSLDYHGEIIYPFILEELKLAAKQLKICSHDWVNQNEQINNVLYRLGVHITQQEAHIKHVDYIFSGRNYNQEEFNCYHDNTTEACVKTNFCFSSEATEGAEQFKFCKYSSTYTSEVASYLEQCIKIANSDMKKLLTPGLKDAGGSLFDITALDVRDFYAQVSHHGVLFLCITCFLDLLFDYSLCSLRKNLK